VQGRFHRSAADDDDSESAGHVTTVTVWMFSDIRRIYGTMAERATPVLFVPATPQCRRAAAERLPTES
jgi:hypothetical protein